MTKYNLSFSVTILRIILGTFFVILGLTGIFRELSESIFSLSSHYATLEVIFGIAELIFGFLLFAGAFLFSDSRLIYWSGLIILIFWVTRIVLSKFIWGLNFIYNGNISIPALFHWLLILTCELAIAAGLLVVIRRNE